MYEMEDLGPWLEDVTGQVPAGSHSPTPDEDLNQQSRHAGQYGAAWNDRRTWADADWVYFPASTNVFAARYCRDGSNRMQVIYGNKIARRTKNGLKPDFPRLYEYGPAANLTPEAWFNFLYAASKGNWSWSNLDPRWGNPVPYRPIYS